MFLALHLPRIAPDFTYQILGTDIDPESVQIASNGVYNRNEIKEVPLPLLSHHWARGTGEISEFVKAKPSIKAACRFEIRNLMELSSLTESSESFDIIFCRNVFIYFTSEQVKKISIDILKRLHPKGFLFIGISETLNGLSLPVSYEGPSIYSKSVSSTASPARPTPSVTPSAPLPAAVIPFPTKEAATKKVLRVLCVDDSPTVIALLKKILVRENGFDVVATASHGIEAAQKLREQTIDILTLDIHMPEQGGLEYLVQNFGPSHPPVVMISSVSREDTGLALECLKRGASDFIEKPALSNITERGEEIRTKLICAYRARSPSQPARDLSLDRSFLAKPETIDVDKTIRTVIANYSTWPQVADFLKECSRGFASTPPTIIFVEGGQPLLEAYAKELGARSGLSVSVLTKQPAVPTNSTISIADFAESFDSLATSAANRKASIVILGSISSHGARRVSQWKNAQVLLEDPLQSGIPLNSDLRAIATDIVPSTSFAYLSNRFLRKNHE
jgi:chemotaxis protein methyltransferase CheR